MGMFDCLSCRRIMPDGFDGNIHSFQTKDFSCDLANYGITDDGKLVRYRDYGSAQEDASPVAEIIEHHGYVTFYTYVSQNEWHQYRAKFTDGKLVEIKTDESY